MSETKPTTDSTSSRIRDRIEEAFGQWGNIVYQHPWKIIFIMLLVSFGLMRELPNIEADTSNQSFLHDDDPVSLRYDEFRLQFSNDSKIHIAVTSDEVFDAAFLKRFKQLHEELEEKMPYLDEVESLINVRHTLGTKDGLIVKDFLEDWPETQEALSLKKRSALENPVYIGAFLSSDSKTAVITVKNIPYINLQKNEDVLDGFEDSSGFEDDIVIESPQKLETLGSDREREIFLITKDIIDRYNQPGFQIHAIGGAFDSAWFLNMVRDEMNRFTLFSILAIAFFLAVLFRRVVIVFLPLSVSILAMLSTMSVMAIVGIKISFSMQIVPAFLLAVGVGNSVHLFTVFFQAVNRGDNKQQALSHALKHSGLAIVMTGLTTAGGLLSFLSSEMKPIAEFGMIAPMGVIFALVYSMILLPAFIAVFPMQIKPQPEKNNNLLRNILVNVGDFSVSHPKKVITVWFAIIGISLYFASQITFSFFPYNNLPEDHYLRQSITKFTEALGGSAPLEIVIDTKRENGIKDPEILKLIDEFQQWAVKQKFHMVDVAKAVSITDINKELHQALNENQKSFYIIPDDKQVISQELLLFENSGADDLQILVDPQFSKARITLTLSFVDGIFYLPVIAKIRGKLDETFEGRSDYYVSGIIDLLFSVFNKISYSMASSYVIAFMIVTPLMILLIGNLKVGLISMIPNLAPIIITLGFMELNGIQLTTATLLMGSIALGLVVDDTIHFMHNFHRYYNHCGDARTAVRQTLETTGQALFMSTIVLSTAFFIFIMNTLSDWAAFGLCTGFCITVAFLADVILAPALVTLLAKHNAKL